MSSGNKIREWPLDYWVELLNVQLKDDCTITADIDTIKVDYLKKNVNSNIRLISLELTLEEYLALVSLCKRIISVDTFSIHAAAGYKKEVIGFYSGIHWKGEWYPYEGDNTIYIKTDCIHYPCNYKDCIFGYPSRCMNDLLSGMIDIT